jgi:hypothetical protein
MDTLAVMEELTSAERDLALMALWNFKLGSGGMAAAHAPADALPALTGGMEMVDEIARKLGGDPDKPVYGVSGTELFPGG